MVILDYETYYRKIYFKTFSHLSTLAEAKSILCSICNSYGKINPPHVETFENKLEN